MKSASPPLAPRAASPTSIASTAARTLLQTLLKKKPKYRNVKVTVDGIEFSSKLEAAEYGRLKLLERAGVITDLVLQPRFPLIVNGVKVAVYVADFSHFETSGCRVITEAKGFKTQAYLIKKRLFSACYPTLRLIEVKK